MLSNAGLILVGCTLAALCLTFWIDALVTGLPQIQATFSNRNIGAIVFFSALAAIALFGPRSKKY